MGKVVGRTKEEVERICDHFNIQVDNPCVILNQDTSKELLRSNKNQDIYNFFLKATQLQKIGSSLKDADALLEEAKESMLNQREQVNSLEDEMNQKKQRYENAKELATIDEKIERTQQELLWAVVADKEEHVDDEKAKLAQYTSKKEELDGEYADADEERSDLLQDKETCSQKLREAAEPLEQEAASRKALFVRNWSIHFYMSSSVDMFFPTWVSLGFVERGQGELSRAP